MSHRTSPKIQSSLWPHFERQLTTATTSYKPFYFSKVAYVHGLLRHAIWPQIRISNDIFCQPLNDRLFRSGQWRKTPPISTGSSSLPRFESLHCLAMSIPAQPNFKLTNAPDYRESYANSVQMRVNVWDFFMVFGTLQQQTETHVEIRNFQGIYLSPQQAKALLGLLQQNITGYETAFGEIKLDPRLAPPGPVH
jgi:hypothetical protein